MHFLDYWSIQDNEIAGYSIHLLSSFVGSSSTVCILPTMITMLGWRKFLLQYKDREKSWAYHRHSIMLLSIASENYKKSHFTTFNKNQRGDNSRPRFKSKRTTIFTKLQTVRNNFKCQCNKINLGNHWCENL